MAGGKLIGEERGRRLQGLLSTLQACMQRKQGRTNEEADVEGSGHSLGACLQALAQ